MVNGFLIELYCSFIFFFFKITKKLKELTLFVDFPFSL